MSVLSEDIGHPSSHGRSIGVKSWIPPFSMWFHRLTRPISLGLYTETGTGLSWLSLCLHAVPGRG